MRLKPSWTVLERPRWLAIALLVGPWGFVGGCGEDEPVVASADSDSTENSSSKAAASTSTAGGAAGASGGAAGGKSDGGASSGGNGAGGNHGGSSGGGTSNGSTSSGGSTSGDSEVVDVTLSFENIRLPGASRTVDFLFVPGTNDELFVLGHNGKLYHYRLAGSSATLLAEAQIPGTLYAKGCGATSLAVDPYFFENGYLYIARCVDLVESKIARYQLDSFEDMGATESEVLSITLPWDRDEWHRFGSMGFESDGDTLWVLTGDMFFPEYAQDTTKKNGSLLRVVPNRDPEGSGHDPAFGNAFEPGGENDPDIYVYGIRSPWRGTRDRFGRFWIGDVGDITAEEINLATEPGQNFGWQDHEGPCLEECAGVRDPIIHYTRAEGKAVWVGELYEEPLEDRYFGFFTDQMFYGDFYGGWVRAVAVNEHGSIRQNREVGRLGEVTQWRVGPDGYMYALTLPSYLYRVHPEPVFADE